MSDICLFFCTNLTLLIVWTKKPVFNREISILCGHWMWWSSGKNQNFNRSSLWLSFLFIFLILNTYILWQTWTEYIGAGNHKEICWNEKFAFEFPSSEWENLTHLKFKIMAEECLFEGGFVGETMWAVLTQKHYSFSVFFVNYQPCNAFVGLSNKFFGLSARKSITDSQIF